MISRKIELPFSLDLFDSARRHELEILLKDLLATEERILSGLSDKDQQRAIGRREALTDVIMILIGESVYE